MKIFLKEEARDLLKDEKFLNAWDQLLDLCPWATIFQSKDFVLTWYTYYEKFIPIVLTDWNGKSLKGIITLTIDKKGAITAAGTDLAEYQVWLSTAVNSQVILEDSIGLLIKHFPQRTIQLKYLPSNTPIKQFEDKTKWKENLFLKTHLQPLMKSNEQLLNKELKKKNRKEKINRLKRMGNLEFEIISKNEKFLNIIDELIIQSDFRKGAMYDKVYFQQETQRKDFLIRLFDLGLLHVSILKLNGEIIASNAGIVGFDMVHLQGINSHSPFFAKFSPGILHFLMLGIELKNTGKKYFDLTPGGAKGYKEMLATTFLEVYELKIYTRFGSFIAGKVEFIKNKIKNIFHNFPKYIDQPKEIVQHFQHLKRKFFLLNRKGLKAFDYDGLNKIFSNQSKTYLTINSVGQECLSNQFHVHENNLKDLMCFDESKGIISRRRFLYDCMKRIEIGHHFYCLMAGDSLGALLWYIPTLTKSGEAILSQVSTLNYPTLAFSYYQPIYLLETDLFLFAVMNQINVPLPAQLQFSTQQKNLKKYLSHKI